MDLNARGLRTQWKVVVEERSVVERRLDRRQSARQKRELNSLFLISTLQRDIHPLLIVPRLTSVSR
jgi:hypothetical protein